MKTQHGRSCLDRCLSVLLTRDWSERRADCFDRRRLALEPLEHRIVLDGQGVLSGTVFDDLNHDGFLTGGEPGLAGWGVELQPVGSTNEPEVVFRNPTPDDWSQFGRFVVLVGENVLIGSHYDDVSGLADAGAAYLFDGSTGNLLHTFVSPSAAGAADLAVRWPALVSTCLLGLRWTTRRWGKGVPSTCLTSPPANCCTASSARCPRSTISSAEP